MKETLNSAILKNDHLLLLNGNDSQKGYIAIGCKKEIVCTSKNINLDKLNDFLAIPNNWKFGYLSYDLKNEFEK